MPYEDPDPDDPMTLNGVTLEAPIEAAVEAAHAYAEELARAGLGRLGILLAFRTPEYRGPYGAYMALGHERIRDIVNESCAVFEACRAAHAGGNDYA
ncbi:MAG: hypothetical protein IT367_09335 [Candidatus Hydrogenedentes bacterium]|nr:hypothetical protein [Candidatus Hydrogenedentota bacterium]